jgi:hypothetical protein
MTNMKISKETHEHMTKIFTCNIVQDRDIGLEETSYNESM